MRVTVFVLGELGRSPRMQYHALSLSSFSKVDFVGLEGSKCHPEVRRNKNIQIHEISDTLWSWMPRSNKLLFMLFAPFKVLLQMLVIFYTLFSVSKPDYILVQNPPAIPSLFIVQVVSWLRGAKLIIDWHNFGFSILGLALGKNNFLVKIAKWIETTLFGRSAYCHFCVSEHMKRVLYENWKIDAIVLYDRPPSIFKELSMKEKHQLFKKLGFKVKTQDAIEQTPFTSFNRETSSFSYLDDRPALIVSSTSWTKDEDFGILLDAIIQCDKMAEQVSNFPKMEFIITGKGPEKTMYEKKISKLKLKFSRIQTKWLQAEDYPKLLACADLGVCLHYSSSGVDLPMKIVDMFGCGLPVCAIHYEAISELVKHGENGLIFKTREELAQQLFNLLKEFPKNKKDLDKMRENLKSFQKHRWDDEWNEKALNLFK